MSIKSNLNYIINNNQQKFLINFIGLIAGFIMLVASTVITNAQTINDNKLSYFSLQQLATQEKLIRIEKHKVEDSFTSNHQEQLLSYKSDNLTLYAMQLIPKGNMPEKGWPLVIFLHGYHPDPINYGRVKNGKTQRPGLYYQKMPFAYADKGYMVVTPDFRGHNDSEGAEFIHKPFTSIWYTRDVINLFNGLKTIDGIDFNRIYLVGHSMGSGISLLSSSVLGKQISAVSLWSIGKWSKEKSPIKENEVIVKNKTGAVPIMIQHGINDQSTNFKNSTDLVLKLKQLNRPHKFISYDVNDHFFTDEEFNKAIAADLDWFNLYDSVSKR